MTQLDGDAHAAHIALLYICIHINNVILELRQCFSRAVARCNGLSGGKVAGSWAARRQRSRTAVDAAADAEGALIAESSRAELHCNPGVLTQGYVKGVLVSSCVPFCCLACTVWFAVLCVCALVQKAIGHKEYAIWRACICIYVGGFEAFVVVGVASLSSTVTFGVNLMYYALADVLPHTVLLCVARFGRPTCLSALTWLLVSCPTYWDGSWRHWALTSAALGSVVCVVRDLHLWRGCRGASAALTFYFASGGGGGAVGCAVLAALAWAYPSFP